VDTGYRHCGTLVVALAADDRARLADVLATQQRLGLDVADAKGFSTDVAWRAQVPRTGLTERP